MKKTQLITYQNFRDINQRYIKYYSSFTNNTVRLNIIDYPRLKDYIIEHYNEEELKWIFNHCPYTLKLAPREGDVKEFMRDNIRQHSTIWVVKREGKKMVFINRAEGGIFSIKEMKVLRDLDETLLDYDEFEEYLFDDFVALRTRLFCESIEKNFLGRKQGPNNSSNSLVEQIADIYRYYEDKVEVDEGLKDREGIVLILTHFSFLEVHDDDTVGIGFKVDTPPNVAATQILKLKEIKQIKQILIYENFYVNESGEFLWNPKLKVKISES